MGFNIYILRNQYGKRIIPFYQDPIFYLKGLDDYQEYIYNHFE